MMISTSTPYIVMIYGVYNNRIVSCYHINDIYVKIVKNRNPRYIPGIIHTNYSVNLPALIATHSLKDNSNSPVT